MVLRKVHSSKTAKYFRKIHPWYFLVLAIFFAIVSVFALRHNNLEMVRYRQAVYAADQKGDSVELEKALYDLRNHVVNHMNTSLTSGANAVHPPIQLKYTYEREQAKQQQALGPNQGGLYHEAQQACASQHPGDTSAAAIACIDDYVSQRGVQLGRIPDGLYKFDFVSATWSPDRAGWSLVFAVVFAVVFLVSAAYRWWSKHYL